jgi:hypothetical protein
MRMQNGPDHAADLNQPPPQLTDWSSSFGDHELTGDRGAQDAAPGAGHSDDSSTDRGSTGHDDGRCPIARAHP